jgi:tetratricopeptide (TPR) repeat protein
MASVFVEQTFKEDTAKKKKRRRIILTLAIIAVILAVIAAIVISVMRAGDRRVMVEIERFNAEGIRFSNYGNFLMAYERYNRAGELAGRLRNNWQYTKRKRDLTDMIEERRHLFGSIIRGDEYLENRSYYNAYRAYRDAQNAYHSVYRDAGIHAGLLVPEILTDKIEQASYYIMASDLLEIGRWYEMDGVYEAALALYRDAEAIANIIGDLAFRREVMIRIFEVNQKMNSDVEMNFIRNVRALMLRAEDNFNFSLALQYAEFIIDVYHDLGIRDAQPREDKDRIERKIGLERNAANYISRAAIDESALRYGAAIANYNRALEIYREMEINERHERVREAVAAVIRLESIAEGAERQAAETERAALIDFHISRAETALSRQRYNDAVDSYSRVLEIYAEMGMSAADRRFRDIAAEIDRIEGLMDNNG